MDYKEAERLIAAVGGHKDKVGVTALVALLGATPEFDKEEHDRIVLMEYGRMARARLANRKPRAKKAT